MSKYTVYVRVPANDKHKSYLTDWTCKAESKEHAAALCIKACPEYIVLHVIG